MVLVGVSEVLAGNIITCLLSRVPYTSDTHDERATYCVKQASNVRPGTSPGFAARQNVYPVT